MKLYLYLFLAITVCMNFKANSSCVEKGEWEILLNDFWFWDIAHEGDFVWCATRGNGVLRYNKTDGSYIQYTTENGLPDEIQNNYVNCVAVDSTGCKWFGFSSEIASFDDTTWTVYTSSDLDNYIGIESAAVDRNNTIWFTSPSGVIAYDNTSFSFHKYGCINNIFVDHNNIKWFSGDDKRIKYEEEEWTFYPKEDYNHSDAVAVDYNNRQFWSVNFFELRIYDANESTIYTELFGEDLIYLSFAVDYHNIKWIGTDHALIRYDDKEFAQIIYFENYDTHIHSVEDIEIDNDGTVWFVAEGGTQKKCILAKYTPEDTTTNVETKPRPEEITLHQAHPNPLNPTTTISYEIPFDAQVRLIIYDILGREITVLQDGMMSAGGHNAVWNGRNADGELAGSGVYIYQLIAGEHKAQGKMLLLR